MMVILSKNDLENVKDSS